MSLLSVIGWDTHIQVMGHVDTCLETLRRLIAAGDMNGIPLAEAAIEEYWAATPVKARKSGLLYIQQILHERSARHSQSAKQGFRGHRGRLHRKKANDVVRPPQLAASSLRSRVSTPARKPIGLCERLCMPDGLFLGARLVLALEV